MDRQIEVFVWNIWSISHLPISSGWRIIMFLVGAIRSYVIACNVAERTSPGNNECLSMHHNTNSQCIDLFMCDDGDQTNYTIDWFYML